MKSEQSVLRDLSDGHIRGKDRKKERKKGTKNEMRVEAAGGEGLSEVTSFSRSQ